MAVKLLTNESLARKFFSVYKKKMVKDVRDYVNYEELQPSEKTLLMTIAEYCLPFFVNHPCTHCAFIPKINHRMKGLK